jgi:hypothetical protein
MSREWDAPERESRRGGIESSTTQRTPAGLQQQGFSRFEARAIDCGVHPVRARRRDIHHDDLTPMPTRRILQDGG